MSYYSSQQFKKGTGICSDLSTAVATRNIAATSPSFIENSFILEKVCI